jgi:hypothetical protein
MKKIRFKIALLPVCIALLFVQCKKNEADTKPDTIAGHIPGMGKTSGNLQGMPFSLPGGIIINNGITGVNPLEDVSGYCQVKGSGLFVLLQLSLSNNTGKDTVLTLPGGLTFHAGNDDMQNGILLHEVKIPLQRDEACNTILFAYCANMLKHASDNGIPYEFGPVTNAPPLQDLVKVLRSKDISVDPEYNEENVSMIASLQSAVWDITDGTGLTHDDSTFINSLN